jgi:hypothetical protein
MCLYKHRATGSVHFLLFFLSLNCFRERSSATLSSSLVVFSDEPNGAATVVRRWRHRIRMFFEIFLHRCVRRPLLYMILKLVFWGEVGIGVDLHFSDSVKLETKEKKKGEEAFTSICSEICDYVGKIELFLESVSSCYVSPKINRWKSSSSFVLCFFPVIVPNRFFLLRSLFFSSFLSVIVQIHYFSGVFELELQGRRFDDEILAENPENRCESNKLFFWNFIELERFWLGFCEIHVEFVWLMMNFVRISGEFCGFVVNGVRLGVELGMNIHGVHTNFWKFLAFDLWGDEREMDLCLLSWQNLNGTSTIQLFISWHMWCLGL